MAACRRRGRLPLLLTLPLLLAAGRPAAALKCLQNGAGTTYPGTDINVEPGAPFNITCLIDPTHPKVEGCSSQHLYFTHDQVLATGVVKSEVPADHITVLNSSAILLTERLDKAVQHSYVCRLRHSDTPTMAICNNNVNVGHPPLEVKNLRCISYNWYNITCDWDEPFNAIKTDYQLQYRLYTNPFYEKACMLTRRQPSNPRPGQVTHTTCVVPREDFRYTHERFKVAMTASNALTSRTFPPVEMETYAIVLPAAPEKVWNSSVTAHSVQLQVRVGQLMSAFPKPIEFDVDYTSRWDDQPVRVNTSSMGGQLHSRKRVRRMTVTDLLPYTEYRFRARLRTSLAVGDDMWSKPAEVAVHTLAAVPAAAPTAQPGSFQLVGGSESRIVYVYWRQVAPRQRNGPHFTYCVTASRPDGQPLPHITPDRITPAYARFSNVTLEAVRFEVAACNGEGRSRNTTSVTVPARAALSAVSKPHAVKLVVSGDGQYQLSWKQYAGPPADSYTIFWCEHMRDRPFQCQGQLDWKHVSGDKPSHSLHIPTPAEFQFAVSANRDDISSGMVWSQCTILANGESIQLGEVYVKSRSDRRLTLAWNEECANRAAVQSYLVYYCLMVDGHCQGNETRLTVDGVHGSSVDVTGLRPYSRYQLDMSVVSARGEGQRSASLTATTLQARSDSPAFSEITAVNSTSLHVQWTPPRLSNGPLQHYTLRVGSRSAKLTANQTELTVSGLQPYTKYNVSLWACNAVWQTVGCSVPASTISQPTVEGAPSQMEPPRTQLLNASAARVWWKLPDVLGGPHPVYTLRVVTERDGVNYTDVVELPAGRQVADVSVPECEPGSPSQRHLFWVRAAVHVSSAQLEGPWSESAEQKCVLTSDWPTATIVAVVVGGAFLMMLVVLVFFLVCSRTKRKLTEMRNLGVNLPPGLERLEKPPLAAFPAERRPGDGHSYGRLVSQAAAGSDRAAAAGFGEPLLQDDSTREECDVEGGDATPAPTDSNSCSSSATNYTDSGAECDKAVSSATYNQFQWPSVEAPKLTPYVQVGGPEAAAAAGPAPPYSKFSPYVDAKAIQALMARSLESLPADGGSCAVSRSEPDLTTAGEPAPLPYSQLGQRSSAGYVSMASDDALPPKQAPPPPAKPELKPYVTLGPPPPPASAAGFPPYVLAGPPADGPTPIASCSPAHATTVSPSTWARPRAQEVHSAPAARAACAAEPPARQVASAGYVLHDKARPGGIELRDMPASTVTSGYVSQEALAGAAGEPVLSPKKLPTVASSRDPYCRVVTSHQGPPDLGPNVSMV